MSIPRINNLMLKTKVNKTFRNLGTFFTNKETQLLITVYVIFLYIILCILFSDEARDSKQGVLVHCLAGVSRSVTITVAYLMQTKKLTLNEAYDYVKTCKPNISPNFNFMGQLLEFQRSLGHIVKCSCGDRVCTCADISRLISEDTSQPDV